MTVFLRRCFIKTRWGKYKKINSTTEILPILGSSRQNFIRDNYYQLPETQSQFLSTEQVGQVNMGQILADLLWAGFSWVRQRVERPKRQITETSKKDTQHIFNAASATTTGLPDGPALSQRKRTSHYRLICVSHQNESCVFFTTVLDLTSHTGSEKEGGWRADWFWVQH